MLNYSKKILQAVSFDQNLFKKEFTKLSDWLSQEEAQKLMNWCIETFDYELLTQSGLLF
jgi:hypothetical protein